MATTAESREILYQLRPTTEKVDQAVAVAIKVAQPSRIFIFGSWARGESRWDSDLDLAILLDAGEEGRIGALKQRLHRELDPIAMRIDLVIVTESYAEEMTDPVNGIFHDIFTEGRLVYDSHRTTATTNCGSAT